MLGTPWRLVHRRASGAFTPSNGVTLRTLAVDTGKTGAWTPTQIGTGGYTEEQLEEGRKIAASLEMYEALKAAEWGGNRGERVCPVCRRVDFEGHKKDCIVAIALAKAGGKAK